MDALCNKGGNFQKKRDGSRSSAAKNKSLTGSSETSSSGSCSSSDSNEGAKAKGSSSSSPTPLGWQIRKAKVSKCYNSDDKENEHSSRLEEDAKFTSISSKIAGKFYYYCF